MPAILEFATICPVVGAQMIIEPINYFSANLPDISFNACAIREDTIPILLTELR